MIRNEADLVKYLMSKCNYIERLENSVKGGTPDTMIPCYSGWQWLELKVIHSHELIFQNTQMAFFVKNRRLPRHLQGHVLGAKVDTDTAILASYNEVLALPRRPYAKGKTAVSLPPNAAFTKLDALIDKMGVYIDL